MGNMNRVALMAGLLAASAPGLAGGAVALSRAPDVGYAPPSLGGGGSIGKGKGKRPHHSSARFVAQDKRDARKARNRSR